MRASARGGRGSGPAHLVRGLTFPGRPTAVPVSLCGVAPARGWKAAGATRDCPRCHRAAVEAESPRR